MTAAVCPIDHDQFFAQPENNVATKPYDQIPADLGWPYFGRTLEYFRDPDGFHDRNYERFGPIWRTRMLTWECVVLHGPVADGIVLMNRDKVFSNQQGWETIVGNIFPGGLMMRDFEEHRQHRLVMQQAFNREPMRNYMIAMNPDIDRYLDRWVPKHRNSSLILFYPTIKSTLLRLAVPVFVGERAGKLGRQLNKAMTDLVLATGAFLRLDVPVTKYGRGMAGRRFLENYFRSRINDRRNGDGSDMFSQMCRAESEEGMTFTDEEIVNHMIFLIFAAHDTNTISNTTMFYQLARNQELQQELREQSRSLGKKYIEHDDLDKLTGIQHVFEEAIRWLAPVPTLFRKTVKDSVIAGYDIPAGTMVLVQPNHTHQMEELWECPAKFDPGRFEDDRAEYKNHKFGYLPFGGGVHKCIGRHFAENQSKALVHQALLKYKWTIREDQIMDMDYSSLPKPKDDLPIKFTRLAGN